MRRPSPASFVDGALARDAVGRPRQGLEALGGDRFAAAEAGAVRPVVEPPERRVDQLEMLLRTFPQGQIALLLEDLAGRRGLRSVRHLTGRLDLLTELGEQAAAFGLERGADRGGVDCRHPATVLPNASTRRAPLYSRGVPEEVSPMAIEIDPVCGMEVDTTTSQLSLEHDGTTYWFCGKGCLLDFQDDPAKYLDPDYSPSM